MIKTEKSFAKLSTEITAETGLYRNSYELSYHKVVVCSVRSLIHLYLHFQRKNTIRTQLSNK